jgi:hypothetical protein
MLYIIILLLIIIAIGILFQSNEGKLFLKFSFYFFKNLGIFILFLLSEIIGFIFLNKFLNTQDPNMQTLYLVPSSLLLLNIFYIRLLNNFLIKKFNFSEKISSLIIAIFILIFMGILGVFFD